LARLCLKPFWYKRKGKKAIIPRTKPGDYHFHSNSQ
jgi:hypothetical protein